MPARLFRLWSIWQRNMEYVKVIGTGADAADFALVGLCQKGDLAVPISGVGVPHDAVAELQLDFRNLPLDGSLFLADVDGYHLCHVHHSFT